MTIDELRTGLEEMDIGSDGVFLSTEFLCALLADIDQRESEFEQVRGHKWFDIECQANGCQSLFLKEAREEIQRLTDWINVLQAGTYVTCVYCGHCYGPDTEVPTCMAEVLRQHIEYCPKHPMSLMRRELEELRAQLSR